MFEVNVKNMTKGRRGGGGGGPAWVWGSDKVCFHLFLFQF